MTKEHKELITALIGVQNVLLKIVNELSDIKKALWTMRK
jgi:hypothetical protein